MDDGIEAHLDDVTLVVIALQKLVEARDVLAFAHELDAVEEGQAPSSILGVNLLADNVLALDLVRKGCARGVLGARLATVPSRMALQLHAVLLFIDGETVGPGADGVIGEVFTALLAVVVGDRFPRHRGGERHGKKVKDLRLGFVENDFELQLATSDDASDATGALILL